MTRPSKINFFQPEIWEEGALEKEIQRNLAIPDDIYGCGQWQPADDPQAAKKYKSTLGGRSIDSYDPNRFLADLGLAQSMTAGRTNVEMLRALHLVDDYRPDTRYFPLPANIAAVLQKALLALSRLSPHLVNAIDRLIDQLLIKKMEKRSGAARPHHDRYGRVEKIVKGDRCEASLTARYFGIVRQNIRQYAWGEGIHTGSIGQGRTGAGNFGTYDIALKLGFTKNQAVRIAHMCFAVDKSKTHYHDPDDATQPRMTGTEEGRGEIHRHYNRSPCGVEDSRITAARIHFDRALDLAADGYYDAAEQELGIGLHSLQDIFCHAHITPSLHTLLAEFPDLVRYHPLAMYETAVVTEDYLKKFIAGLKLDSLSPAPAIKPRIQTSEPFITGSATAEEKNDVAGKMAEFPAELTAFLETNGIHIFVGAEGARLTDLGFGQDLDGDGKITPGRWVDVNRDGQKQWFEVEDLFDGGREWNHQPAAYNHHNRIIFISVRILKAPEFEEILKHEINHALDSVCQDHPQLGVQWKAYINKLYNDARRKGKIAFDALDPHEYFAGCELR
jgi:hypothetical protein